MEKKFEVLNNKDMVSADRNRNTQTAGPRICLWEDFAYRPMKIVAMALVGFFRFKLANGTQNVTYKVMFTLHMDKGLHLCAIPR
ncbi:hypothetical protein JHK82_048526 [Glycine max]|nr:hypothetical protein JHK82_048526 [Glycine max]KAG5103446.1 hypothetical protein JHK84_048415 [Glycine max]